jgi:Family of unknown function (DUF6982)
MWAVAVPQVRAAPPAVSSNSAIRCGRNQESALASPPLHGCRIEIVFQDGESLSRTTDAYNPRKLRFVVFPMDPQSNNLRVLVVNKNVRQVKML